MRGEIDRYLRQRVDEASSVSKARDELAELIKRCAQRSQALQAATGAAAAKPVS